MRLKNLIIGDMKFQFKYGFYLLYAIFTILYIGILLALPGELKTNITILLVLTDPAAMGLFFMGAILLFEKSQRVLNSLAVSPIKVKEYIISKIVSLGIISTLVGVIIAVAGGGMENIILFLIGIILGSSLFTLLGLIIAAKITTLNGFLIATVPVEIIMFIPAIAYIFGFKPAFLQLHPAVAVAQLLTGTMTPLKALFSITILCLWIVLFYFATHNVISKMIRSIGGIKL